MANPPSFYALLAAAINEQLVGVYPTTLTPIQFPSQGDFFWYYQNENQVFNEGTFNYLSARVSPGDAPGLARLSAAGGFPNAYSQIISCIEYKLSKADEEKRSTILLRSQTLATKVVETYESLAGKITPAELETARAVLGAGAVLTPLDYVVGYVVGYVWSGKQTQHQPPLRYQEMMGARNLADLLPQMPLSGQPLLPAVENWLNALEEAAQLQDEVRLGTWRLAQLKANTTRPTQGNGGMLTVNPNTGTVSAGYQVGYEVSNSLATIAAGLSSSRSLEVTFTVSPSPGGGPSLSMRGGSPLQMEQELTYIHGNGIREDLLSAPGSGRPLSLTLNYTGFVLVPLAPIAWQQATYVGWFDAEPIAQAHENGDRDVTGFRFTSPPGYALRPFAEGGDFGRLTGLLISNPPIVTLHYENGDCERFQECLREWGGGRLNLFGQWSVGLLEGDGYTREVRPGTRPGDFSVKFSPRPPLASVPLLQQAAYVIGGVLDFPAVRAEKARGVEDRIAAR